MAKPLICYHGQKVIILIDEYDTPIHEAFYNKYYDDCINFFRVFFGAGLKDNSNIYKGFITGILRIAKESIFSDLNSLGVFTVLNNRFSDKFGFTPQEVKDMLKYYDLEDKTEQVKNGMTDIYSAGR